MLLTNPSAPPPPTHLLGVLRTLWIWRRPIILTTVAGAVIAVIVSLLLPTYFTGYTSFVAISPEQISLESTFGATGARVQFYGNGDDIDRLITIGESNEIFDFLVDSFKLFEVYDIDSTTRKGPVYVVQELQSRYGLEKTPRDIIELTVEDRNPVRAAAMTTAARERINEINLRLIRATHGRNAGGLEREVIQGQARIEAMNDQLSALRKESGIYDTESQSEALSASSSGIDQQIAVTEARLQAFRELGSRDSITKLSVNLTGLQRNRELLDEQLQRLNENVGEIENLEEDRQKANMALSDSRTRLKRYEAILFGDRRTLEVIEETKLPLVKSWPIRWLIVAVATVFTFLCAVVGVLLLESGRRFDWGSITR